MVEKALGVRVAERAIEHFFVFEHMGHHSFDSAEEAKKHLNVEIEELAVNAETKFDFCVVDDNELFDETWSVFVANDFVDIQIWGILSVGEKLDCVGRLGIEEMATSLSSLDSQVISIIKTVIWFS